MKNNLTRRLTVYIFTLLVFLSCKKERFYAPLDSVPGLSSVVEGSNVQVVWQAPSVEFDSFVLEVSKTPDFTILESTTSIEKSSTSHILRGLDLGEDYFVRIKSIRRFPESSSEWSTLDFNTKKGNILLPITNGDIAGNRVTLKWDFPANEPIPPHITRLVLVPHIGPAIELPLSEADRTNKTLTFDKLTKDVQYTVRIYNYNFLRGTQVFTTAAEPANGIWTLGPHSDLKAAIELSKSGDKIVLKPGTYNFWLQSISIENKSITIEAENPASAKPKVYVKNFLIAGSGTGVTFSGLDLSGARVDQFKKEIPNTPDTRWNRWLIAVDEKSSNFDQINFENCILRNYYTGILSMIEGQTGNAVTINNSIIHHTGQDQTEPMLSVGAARIKVGTFTNSTYYVSNKMFIAIDREKNLNNDIVFTFKNNTVDNSWEASAFDFKASKLPTRVLLQNNIFSNIKCAANFFNNFAHVANNFDKRLINCNFFNVLSKSTIYGKNTANMPVTTWELRHPNALWNEVKPAFIMNDANHINPNSISEYPLSIDPGYLNPVELNFKISASSTLRAVDGGKPIGDPRWW